ncbi:MAG: SPFH domain-containing protein [Candidatus Methylacidiphilales bacterium]|nr:SPFH domain-containing protein [Candidatus Methylacidiphilales bacterium]
MQTIILADLLELVGGSWPWWVHLAIWSLVVLLFLPRLTGAVLIHEWEVGLVVKKFGSTQLAPGEIIALNGEAGYQADTLAPGLHFGYWFFQYNIIKTPMVRIPAGEIGLVLANAGTAIASERILARSVPCDNFQDARAFLVGGGEKGRQLAILTAGTYRINTALFNVITGATAGQFGLTARDLRVYPVESDAVGIVTTLDGRPIEPGEIAGESVPEHDNFQNAQAFLQQGGRRGLQEQILLAGTWNLNPWFAHVEQVAMLEIPIGYVGVVISFVGKAHLDISGTEFRHGDLVNPGHKGVWVAPLYPGKHPINPRIMKVELVPTTNIVLNWANRTEAHKFDQKLNSITVRSNDGFAFNLDVSQIIHVGALDAPKVISRVGSMQNLVDHVLQPTVGNYFRNSAQNYTVLDFLGGRTARQKEASEFIRRALAVYDVQAVDTLIGDITPPETLMKTQTDRKIAEEERKTYETQQAAQQQRQLLVRETALADIQQRVVESEQSVQIAELQANARVRTATGEAESIRLRAMGEAEAIRATGQAHAEAYSAGVLALGPEGFAALQLMQIVGDRGVRVVPDVAVTGGGGSGSLVDALLGDTLRRRVAATHAAAAGEEKLLS